MMPDRIDIKAANMEAEACRDQLIAFRRRFHSRPELGLSCHETAAAAADYLESLGLTVETGLAESGVAGLLTGARPGPTIALRADMDALPITEETGLPFASQRPGMMHACGHDGHTAIGLGAAAILTRMKERLSGSIKFIFQPGEESPGGAKRMIQAGVMKDPEVALVLGFHILPSHNQGHIGVCRGTANAGDIEFEARLDGKGGHAARPYQCNDPIVAAGRLIADFQTLTARQSDPLDPVVVSITEIHGGKGHNIIPNTVTLRGTIRYLTDASREMVLDRIHDIGAAIYRTQGVGLTFEIQNEDPPLILDRDVSSFLESEAAGALGEGAVTGIDKPSMGAEDFAWFTRAVPCGYLRLGSYNPDKGHTADLHNSRFDFDEELLVSGAGIVAFLTARTLDFPGLTGIG